MIVVIYSYPINNWYEILLSQINRIKKSGLYDNLTSLYIIMGGDIIPNIVDSNIFIIPYNPQFQYEYQALDFIKEISTSENKILYIHSKGVTKIIPPISQNVMAWRLYMEEYLIDNWKECIELLDTYDVLGVDYKSEHIYNNYNYPHFSGNFWWANGNYTSKLPTITSLDNNDRLLCEFWICMGNPKIHCLNFSDINLYHTNYYSNKLLEETKIKFNIKEI